METFLKLDPERPFKDQFLNKFASIALLAFGLEFVVILLSSGAIESTTFTLAFSAVSNQTNRQITSTARELADVVSSKLQNIDSTVVQPTAVMLQQIYDEDYPLLANITKKGRPFNQSAMRRSPSEVTSSAQIDPNNAMWYYSRAFDGNTSPQPYDQPLSASLTTFVKRMAALAPVMKATVTSTPAVVSVYAGIELPGKTTGAFCRYPMATFAATSMQKCSRGNGPCYDPKVRPWYTGAVANNANTFITEPYKDASTGGWMVTVAKAVYASPGYSAGGSLVGVVGADIYLTAIQNDILTVKVLESGDAALMMRSGVLLADKDWINSGPSKITRIYEGENVAGAAFVYANDKAAFDALLSKLETSTTKSVTTTRETKTNFTSTKFSVAAALAYGTADRNKDNEYVILVKVAKEEIDKPVVQVTSGIQSVMWITRVFALICIVAVFFFERDRIEEVSVSITKPIEEMSATADDILNHDGEVETIDAKGLRGQDDEIGWLVKGFKAMILGLGHGKKRNLGGAEVKLWENNPVSDDSHVAKMAVEGNGLPWK